MTSVPFPSFRRNAPVNLTANRGALFAVGRCRIYPETLPSSEEYAALVDGSVAQAIAAIDETLDEEGKKKLEKKLMKSTVSAAQKYLTEYLNIDVSVIDVEVVVSAEEIIRSDGCLASNLLDAGCEAIVTDGCNLDALETSRVPKERLIGQFEYEVATKLDDALVSKVAQLCDAITVTMPTIEGLDESKVIDLIKRFPTTKVVVEIPGDQSLSDAHLIGLVGGVSRAIKGEQGSFALTDPTSEQMGLSYAACLKTDRQDGLFTTVVCTRNGEALGLVYSSPESIVASLQSGRGVYYSRSRQGLWRKGDTSGNFQTLHRLDVDCDGDALRFTVTQCGETPAFCHLNTLSCWGHPRGIRHLEETLQDRLRSSPEGSYTKRLFEDPELLRDKLVEEAQELSEATDRQDVAAELADVLYFAMVRATKAGVSIDDAAAELDRRSRKVTRRKGDSKAFRIAAGKAILDNKKQVEK